MRVKEIQKKIKKTIKIDRMMTKRNFEYLKDKSEALKSVKSSKGKIDFKISKTVRTYFEEFLCKINCFESTFQEIELLSSELVRLMDKVSLTRLPRSRTDWRRSSTSSRKSAC